MKKNNNYNGLNNIWRVNMHLDLTSKDREEGLDECVEFTKIGLIDYINNEYSEEFGYTINYNMADEGLKIIVEQDLGMDYKVEEIREV